jgi:hypothetical protein
MEMAKALQAFAIAKPAFESIYSFDSINPGFYQWEDLQGSALYGLQKNLGRGIESLVTTIYNADKGLSPTSVITAAGSLDPFSKGIISLSEAVEPFKLLSAFDSSNPGFYQQLYQGSAIWGTSDSIGKGIDALISVAGLKYTPEQFDIASSNTDTFMKMIESLNGGGGFFGGVSLPEFMKLFQAAKPMEFKDGLFAVYDGVFKIATVNSKDGGKRSFFKMFADEILRLSAAADPFTKFVSAFGKMSKDMKVFAENFKIMDGESLLAFKNWTDSLVALSKTNPSTFAANVTTANKAISAAYNSSDGDPNTKDPSDVAKNAGEKKAAAKDSTKGQPIPPKTEKAQKMEIDYAAIGRAVASALASQTLTVSVSGSGKPFGK